MNDFLIYVLACIGAHRIWNFEEIFRPTRDRLLRRHNSLGRWSPLKPVLCHACNAFWIALLLAVWLMFAPSRPLALVEQSLAAYAVVRLALWSYAAVPAALKRARTEPSTLTTVPTETVASGKGTWTRSAVPGNIRKSAPSAALVPKPTVEVVEVKSCDVCGAKKKALVEQQASYAGYEKRVVLLTSLASFHPSYSLVSVIFDQARMLAANDRWLVQIWVNEGTDLKDLPALPDNVQVLAIVPRVFWKLDVVDPVDRDVLSSTVRKHLMQLGNATIISHDMLFISHYLTFAAAIHDIGQTKAFTWIHVCHSAAENNPPLPTNDLRYRYTVPDGHYLLCLNVAEREHLAAHYHTSVDRVLVCPNARDVTTFGAFDEKAATLVHKHRLAEADIVQVYPVSSTRLKPKGVPLVIDVLARLARDHGKTVRLVLATAHANAQREKNELIALRKAAIAKGLPSDALVITSEDYPDLSADGLPAASIKDLFSISNLFIFPSLSELSSLVLREAALSGALLVTNTSLHTTPAELAMPGLSFPFGSIRNGASKADPGDVAAAIVKALDGSPSNVTKRFALKRYCYGVVGSELTALILSAKPI